MIYTLGETSINTTEFVKKRDILVSKYLSDNRIYAEEALSIWQLVYDTSTQILKMPGITQDAALEMIMEAVIESGGLSQVVITKPDIISVASVKRTFTAAPENIDTYKTIFPVVRNWKIGSCEQWPGGKEYYPKNAFEFLRNTKHFVRKTIYDDSLISLYGYSVGPASLWVEYFAKGITFNYHPAANYFSTLKTTYDCADFLTLLKLHRSAGVETIPSYSSIKTVSPFYKNVFPDAYDSLPNSIVMAFGPQPQVVKDRYNPYVDTEYLKRMNVARVADAWATANIVQAAAHNPDHIDIPAIQAVENIPYDGYQYAPAFFDEVSRYRERVLLHGIRLVQDLLYTAQTESQTLVSDLVTAFITEGETPLYEIDKSALLNVASLDGTAFIKQAIPIYLSSSIRSYLRMQYEAAIWFYLANQEKYGARLANLSDPNAILGESGGGTFQTDPWRNPFLIFDKEKTMASKTLTPTFTDMACHLAQKPVDKTTITDDLVRLPDFQNASKYLTKFLRQPVAGTFSYKSPFEKEGAGTTGAPWVLAAIAAAGAFYFMNK